MGLTDRDVDRVADAVIRKLAALKNETVRGFIGKEEDLFAEKVLQRLEWFFQVDELARAILRNLSDEELKRYSKVEKAKAAAKQKSLSTVQPIKDNKKSETTKPRRSSTKKGE